MMQKSFVLIATIAATASAYILGEAHHTINNNFAVASMELDAVIQRNGLRVAEYSHKEHKHGKVEAGKFNIIEQRYQCAQGFAFGL